MLEGVGKGKGKGKGKGNVIESMYGWVGGVVWFGAAMRDIYKYNNLDHAPPSHQLFFLGIDKTRRGK